MLRWAILVLVALGTCSAAVAEPTSIRCSDSKLRATYFVTFDLETKHVAFESDLHSLYRGDVQELKAGQIKFEITGDDGKIDMTFEPHRMRMVWAGFVGDVRPVMIHDCKVVGVRTPLSRIEDIGYSPDYKKLFSLRCSDLGQVYYFTFDLQSKKVAHEDLGIAIYPGTVRRATDKDIAFDIRVGRKKFQLNWDKTRKTVTWIGIPGDSTRPTKENACERIKLRTILQLRLWDLGRAP